MESSNGFFRGSVDSSVYPIICGRVYVTSEVIH